VPDPSTPVELLRSLAVFAEPPSSEHTRLAEVIGLPSVPTASEYSDVFLFQLYPYASVHLGAEGMMGGDARDRVAGFWNALGQTPPAEPDHLASLLGLYVTLTEQAASRERGGGEVAGSAAPGGTPGSAESGAEAVLLDQARGVLLREHIAPWVFPFLARVEELAPGPYGVWASLLADVLRAEIVREDLRPLDAGRPIVLPSESAEADPDDVADPLPVHLSVAPDLPDPRVDGSEEFLTGLLAPVRSGAILTRADLARISGGLDLGLRAGERRYALEHLLAQDAEGVLGGLADEVARQGRAHRDREEWLGAGAAFFAERAETTVALLKALAETTEPVGSAS